jgi:hypothetical protein
MFKSSNIHTPHSKPIEHKETNKMDVLQPVNRGETDEDSTQSSEKDGRGKNPASQANLKPFEKGHSGNPGGRQKKNVRFINALKAYGKLDPESTVNNWIDDGRTNSESVVRRVWKDAVSGDKQAIRLMMDYEVFEDGLEEPV